mmetsp:Transcript_30699/g.42915  ORF Transcript_30699/g.42915 Transcript_30699/m.42915 type:complete len:148 (-) Transcript_30699:28-471(-)
MLQWILCCRFNFEEQITRYYLVDISYNVEVASSDARRLAGGGKKQEEIHEYLVELQYSIAGLYENPMLGLSLQTTLKTLRMAVTSCIFIIAQSMLSPSMSRRILSVNDGSIRLALYRNLDYMCARMPRAIGSEAGAYARSRLLMKII